MKIRGFLYAVWICLFCSACFHDKNKGVYPIAPPFEGIELKEERIAIDPTVEQVVRFPNGLSVEIPVDAFCDANGKPISEKVELSLEMYDSKAKIMMSGIPMKYNDGNDDNDFESAGMFKLQGYADNTKVQIRENKKLTVNYPSKTAGDFDVFYFDETAGGKVQQAGMNTVAASDVRKGKWEKLLTEQTGSTDISKAVKDFKLKFDSKKYPELEALNAINWHLATTYKDPTKAANNWVLNEPWTSLEISYPRYGFADPIMQEVISGQFNGFGSMAVSNDKQTVAISSPPSVKIWSKKNNKIIATIDNISEDYSPIRFINNNYLLVEQQNGMALFTASGKKIGNYGKTHSHEFSFNKQRVVYFMNGNMTNEYAEIILADLSGRIIKKFRSHNQKNIDFEKWIYVDFFLTPEDELVINQLDGIHVYDLDGNLLHVNKEVVRDIHYISKGKILCNLSDGRLMVWDFKNDRTVRSKEDFNLLNKQTKEPYRSYSRLIEKMPFAIVSESTMKYNSCILWNYETNNSLKMDFYANSTRESVMPEIIYGYNGKNSEYHIYNLNTKKNLITVPKLTFYGEGEPCPQISKDKSRLILSARSHVCLYDLQGKMIRNFKKYDSLTLVAGFIADNKLATISTNGIYRTWDMGGNMLRSTIIENRGIGYGYFDEGIRIYDNVCGSEEIIDVNGSVFLNTGKMDTELLDSNLIAGTTYKKKMSEIFPLVKLEKGVAQLILRTAEKDFYTYVYLDEQTIPILDQYKTFQLKREREEGERQAEEQKILRRLEVAKFGIYNCDKLINWDNNVPFAANFEFDVPVEFNDITVFLITEVNGKAVISFRKGSWERFLIDPKRSNKLIAVLPGNKIAVYTSEQMKQVDWAKVKAEKKYTFKMKTVDKKIDSPEALEVYL